jgi:uncharacterized membrane protein YeaQ/YmgE (transglycosylase-associated protein family)
MSIIGLDRHRRPGRLDRKHDHRNNARMGLLANIIVGIIGGFIGGFIVSLLGGRGITGFNFWSLIVAVIGSVVLLLIVNAFSGKK